MTGSPDHPAVLDSLQLVVSGERDAVGTLTAVPADIFLRAEEEIRALRRIFSVCSDPLTGPFRTATERIESLQQHLEDLVRMRSQKILLLALSRSEGRTVDREELKRMLPAEVALFEAVCASLEEFRRATIPDLHSGVGDRIEADGTACAAAIEEAGVPRDVETPVTVLVRVLLPVEPFLGFDGQVYALEPEDIVTLPRENAAVLMERNIILSIFPDQ
ncbi:MAG TPA: hypothetical protein PLI31_00035 [Methanoregulaceae archaeon]|nr:hypothetical protein [Methanoregulaceae archaeon]